VLNDTHICEQFLNLQIYWGLDFVFVCLFRFRFLCVFALAQLTHSRYSFVVCFCRVEFSFLSTEPRNWLGRTSPNWRILYRVVRKTLTQSTQPSNRGGRRILVALVSEENDVAYRRCGVSDVTAAMTSVCRLMNMENRVALAGFHTRSSAHSSPRFQQVAQRTSEVWRLDVARFHY